MIISTLHYVTQGARPADHLNALEDACKAGCNWVQLRMKECTYEDYRAVAREGRAICTRFNARLIINDSVDIAREVKSDGVHVGALDMPVDKARRVLGNHFIIGGTANTLEDIQRLSQTSADYIGLGPLRYTATKKVLSPLLGLAGYQRLVSQCKDKNIRVPLIAIGGITEADIDLLRAAGVYGVAISSAITQAANQRQTVQSILKKLALAPPLSK